MDAQGREPGQRRQRLAEAHERAERLLVSRRLQIDGVERAWQVPQREGDRGGVRRRVEFPAQPLEAPCLRRLKNARELRAAVSQASENAP